MALFDILKKTMCRLGYSKIYYLCVKWVGAHTSAEIQSINVSRVGGLNGAGTRVK